MFFFREKFHGFIHWILQKFDRFTFYLFINWLNPTTKINTNLNAYRRLQTDPNIQMNFQTPDSFSCFARAHSIYLFFYFLVFQRSKRQLGKTTENKLLQFFEKKKTSFISFCCVSHLTMNTTVVCLNRKKNVALQFECKGHWLQITLNSCAYFRTFCRINQLIRSNSQYLEEYILDVE